MQLTYHKVSQFVYKSVIFVCAQPHVRHHLPIPEPSHRPKKKPAPALAGTRLLYASEFAYSGPVAWMELYST